MLGDNEVEQILAAGAAEGYSRPMCSAAEKLVERASRIHVPAVRIARLYAHAAEKDLALEPR